MGRETVNDGAVWRPPPRLEPYLDAAVGYRMAGFAPGEHIGLPSRHVTFVVSFDDPLELSVLPDGRRDVSRFDAVVGGLHTRPAVIRHDGTQHGVHLQVTPAGARALFGLPAGALAATVVPLAELWGPLATELVDRLGAAATWPARFAVLDDVLVRAVAARPEPSTRPETDEAWRQLAASSGAVGVARLAEHVGWSRRHLTARFTDEYGVGPKELARVLRFQRSRQLVVRPDRPTLASIAARCGYADQSHMVRDWRDLAGASPLRWLADEQLPFVQDGEEAISA